jgi:hypothetical protein
MRIRTSLLAGCCAIAALPACARFKTTDQIRNELLAADSTSGTRWYVEPCEVPAMDTFGWRADSLGPVRFKIPPLVRVVPNPRFGERSFRYGTGTLNIRLAPDAGIIYQGYVYQSPRWREESCSISDRPADGPPLQKNIFACHPLERRGGRQGARRSGPRPHLEEHRTCSTCSRSPSWGRPATTRQRRAGVRDHRPCGVPPSRRLPRSTYRRQYLLLSLQDVTRWRT